MAIELRPCEPAHVPLMLHVLLGWGDEGSEASPPGRRELLALTRAPERGGVWLVEHGGVPVGYAVIERLAPRGFVWQEARLAALFVAPEARRLGIGRAVRSVLRELLLGQGFALLADPVAEDRHWAPLLAPPAEWMPGEAAA